MKNKTILEKKHCVLLNRSNQIKNNPQYKFILPFIKKEEIISYDEMLSNGVKKEKIEKFLENKGDLISITAKEWTNRKQNYVVIKKGNCQFCNTNIADRFYITNMKNSNEMYVGGTCINLFSADAQLAYRSELKTLKELQNREYLEEYHSELAKEYNEKNFLYNQVTIVLKKYENEYKKIKEKFQNKYGTTIKNKTNKNIEELEEIYSNLKIIKNKIKEKCKENLNKKFVITKKFYEYLRKDKKFDLAIQTAKETGKPAPPTIEQINYLPFLNDFEDVFNELYSGELSISFLEKGNVLLTFLQPDVVVELILKNEIILRWFKTIIEGKINKTFYDKINLFVGSIESSQNVLKPQKIYKYFEKIHNLNEVNKTYFYHKSSRYNNFIYEHFRDKIIYKDTDKLSIHVLDRAVVLRYSIILLIDDKINSNPIKSHFQELKKQSYESDKALKNRLKYIYDVRESMD